MKTFDKILVAVDFSENSNYAFNYALTLARAFNSRLIIVHTTNNLIDHTGFDVGFFNFEGLEEQIMAGAQGMMEKFCKTGIVDFNNYESFVIAGIPHIEILKKAQDENVDLIVMGTHGRSGVDHVLFGSTAERVLRKAACPVLTVRLP